VPFKVISKKIRGDQDMLKENLIKSIRFKRRKNCRYFSRSELEWCSLVAIFVENIGSFSKLKIIGLNQDLLNKLEQILSLQVS
jgi:CMP-2-keto-3-deoxyoctulosonic acid synthetase